MRDYHGQLSKDHACESVEQFYRNQLNEVIDWMTTKINDRFDQKTLNLLISIEELVINAANGATFDLDSQLLKFLEGDVQVVELQKELNILSKYVAEVDPQLKEVTSIATVMDIIKKGKLLKVFSELHILLRLYLTIPLSNATAERSFSALRRVKTYLRSRLTQEHLNHYLILHCHKELTDSIDLTVIRNNFVKVNERRMKFYGA